MNSGEYCSKTTLNAPPGCVSAAQARPARWLVRSFVIVPPLRNSDQDEMSVELPQVSSVPLVVRSAAIRVFSGSISKTSTGWKLCDCR